MANRPVLAEREMKDEIGSLDQRLDETTKVLGGARLCGNRPGEEPQKNA